MSEPRPPDDRPPFDTIRAAFYLVAGVIGVHAFVVLLGAVWCVYRLTEPTVPADFVCDPKGRLSDLLGAALAAALAFAGGYTRRSPPDDRPPPPPR